MNPDEIAESIMRAEGLIFALDIADFAASHHSEMKRKALDGSRNALKHAIAKALEECSAGKGYETMSFDPKKRRYQVQKCYELAKAFLESEGYDNERANNRLAQLIQNTIEDWIEHDDDSPRAKAEGLC